MTTSTAAPTTTTAPAGSLVVGVLTAEVTRLESLAAAGSAARAAADAQARLAAAAVDLASNVASRLQQEASVLQQNLAAAQTGPARHTIELALNANRIQRIHTGLDQLAAAGAKAGADAAVTRIGAANGLADRDLLQARQALAAAMADAGNDATLTTGLTTVYAAAVAAAAAQTGRVTAAVTQLGTLLGGDAVLARVRAAVGAAQLAEEALIATADTAQDAVRAADIRSAQADGAVADARAWLLRARDAATDAVTKAPGRVTAATAVVDTVLAMAPAPEQPTIDAAAAAVVPGAPATYDAWLVTLPDGVIDAAVALLDAQHALSQVAGDPQTFVKDLVDADRNLAAALSAQLAARADRAAAASVADVAQAALAAAPDPAERHRAAFLRGE